MSECACVFVCNQKPLLLQGEGEGAWQLALCPLNGEDISPGAVLMR